MDATSSATLVTNAVATLTGYLTYLLPIVIPTIIGVMILFALLGWLRSLYNRRA